MALPLALHPFEGLWLDIGVRGVTLPLGLHPQLLKCGGFMKDLIAVCVAAIFALLFGGIIVWIENRREHDWWEDFEK